MITHISYIPGQAHSICLSQVLIIVKCHLKSDLVVYYIYQYVMLIISLFTVYLCTIIVIVRFRFSASWCFLLVSPSILCCFLTVRWPCCSYLLTLYESVPVLRRGLKDSARRSCSTGVSKGGLLIHHHSLFGHRVLARKVVLSCLKASFTFSA